MTSTESNLHRGYLTDFNASGYPEKYSEKCVAQALSSLGELEDGNTQ